MIFSQKNVFSLWRLGLSVVVLPGLGVSHVFFSSDIVQWTWNLHSALLLRAAARVSMHQPVSYCLCRIILSRSRSVAVRQIAVPVRLAVLCALAAAH
jgi:hypothetical protein